MSGRVQGSETDSDATTCDSAEWKDDRPRLSDDDIRETHAPLIKPLRKFPTSSSSATSGPTSLHRDKTQGRPGGMPSSSHVTQESKEPSADFRRKWGAEIVQVSDESDDISCPPSKKEVTTTFSQSQDPAPSTGKPAVSNKRKGNTRSVRKVATKTDGLGSKKRKPVANRTQSSSRAQISTTRKRVVVAKGMQFEDDLPPLQDSVKPRDLTHMYRLSSSSSDDDDTVGHRLLRSRKRVPKDSKDIGGVVKSKNRCESEPQSFKVESQIASLPQSEASIPTSVSDVMDAGYSLDHEAVSEHSLSSHQLIDELFGDEPSPPQTSDLEMATTRRSHAVENPEHVNDHAKMVTPLADSETTPSGTKQNGVKSSAAAAAAAAAAQVQSNSITLNPVESQDSLVDLDAELFGF